MFDFLKELFYNKENELTVVLLDDEHPEKANSYEVRPARLWTMLYGVLGATVAVVLLLMMFTPLGTLFYNQPDDRLRQQVIDVSQRVQALQDSLQARDLQLSQIQDVLMTGSDTTFEVSGDVNLPSSPVSGGEGTANPGSVGLSDGRQVAPAYEMISQNEIIFSDLFSGAPTFPVAYPVEGTLTRDYQPANRHYGIDIATGEGTEFRALADGSIVSQDWSVNYGYVIHVQHAGGLISIYKHVTRVNRSIGDVVLKGEILGAVGDTGILSTGPHLHLEIWKNGVPQNPNSFLINP
ncbi:MAG: M23 family metallopeptidase [Balneolaceae bacterium]|nr:M23 family metallopeptidase [Balneolaceae bacterium]